MPVLVLVDFAKWMTFKKRFWVNTAGLERQKKILRMGGPFRSQRNECTLSLRFRVNPLQMFAVHRSAS